MKILGLSKFNKKIKQLSINIRFEKAYEKVIELESLLGDFESDEFLGISIRRAQYWYLAIEGEVSHYLETEEKVWNRLRRQ